MKTIKNIHDVDTRYEFIKDFENTNFLDEEEISMMKKIFKDRSVLYIFYKGFNYSITRNVKRFKREENNTLDLNRIRKLFQNFDKPE